MRSTVMALVLLTLCLTALPALADPGGGSMEQVDSQARAFYDQGMDHFRKSQWNLAIQAFLQAVRVEPRFVEAWNNLGYSYRKAKDNQRALDAYRRALDLRPDFKFAHEYIARLYLVMGNREMAVRHYEILRRLDPQMAAQLLRAIEANDADVADNPGGY